MGDHFVCNGLVHKLSEDYDEIYLPCKAHNFKTIEYLYSESPKIKVFKIHNEVPEINSFASITGFPILLVGFQYHDPKNWDKSFYQQVNIDFSERYKSFYFPKNPPNNIINPPNEDYILVHDQSSVAKYDLNIKTNFKIIEVEQGLSDNLFSYIEIIKNAKEIHCINSSVFHLIDSISNLTPKLYYHDIRDDDGSKFEISKKWKIITY